MSPRRVAVVGGGFAGVAAAWAFRKRNLAVTLIEDRAGSSEFYSGIVYGDVAAYAEASRNFAEELGLWRSWSLESRANSQVNDASVGEWNASTQGIVVPSIAADRAILNLAEVAGKRVGVADLGRDDMNAKLLAAVLAEQSWARKTHTQFVAVPVNGLKLSNERRIPVADFAALHDAPERTAWLAAQLSEHTGYDAWLLGPWLGVDEDVAARLRTELGIPVGEVGSRPGGTAGARWSCARSKMLARWGVVPERARLVRVTLTDTGAQLSLQPDEGEGRILEVDAVVLATGGVAAGGIVMEGSLAHSHSERLKLSYLAPLELELDGDVLSASDPSLPLALQSDLGVLERIGVGSHIGIHSHIGQSAHEPFKGRLEVAGDMLAGQSRTVAAAVTSGIAASERLLSRFEK
ncbi:MAG: FAD-dependent oxidoreductase [Polyangiaceae bacterium]|nr:FAD-dependent oxidoreductase [Polyangiaceae bacterium]